MASETLPAYRRNMMWILVQEWPVSQL